MTIKVKRLLEILNEIPQHHYVQVEVKLDNITVYGSLNWIQTDSTNNLFLTAYPKGTRKGIVNLDYDTKDGKHVCDVLDTAVDEESNR